MSRTKTIISHIFKYTSASYFSQFLGFFTAVFMRIFLGPVLMGIWSMLRIILDYADYANLGTIATVIYKLPILKGQKKHEMADRLIRVVFTFTIVTSFICAIGVAAYAVIFRNSISTEIFIGLLATSVVLILQRLYTYYIGLLRAHKDFSVLSKVIVFDAIVNLSLILLIVSKFRLYGLFAVVVLMPVLNMFFIRRHVRYNLKLSSNYKDLLSTIKYGFPIFVSNILEQVLNSIDRIMIVSMLGLQQLGFYSIAIMARNYSSGLARNFGIVIQPYFLEDFGEKNNEQRSFKHTMLFSEITGYFMSGFLSIIFIVSPVFITYVLPKFSPGISALRWYLLTTFFASISVYFTTFLVALEKQKKIIPIMFFAIIINVFLNYVFIKKGYGINGAALATSIAAFFSFVIIFAYTSKRFVKIRQIFSSIFMIFLPVIYSGSILALMGMKIKFQNIIVESSLKSFVFILAFLPLLFYLDKRTGIIKILLKMLYSKLKKV